jgi:hypothetical protein
LDKEGAIRTVFPNQVFLEGWKAVISGLKIQSLGRLPAETFLEREMDQSGVMSG